MLEWASSVLVPGFPFWIETVRVDGILIWLIDHPRKLHHKVTGPSQCNFLMFSVVGRTKGEPYTPYRSIRATVQCLQKWRGRLLVPGPTNQNEHNLNKYYIYRWKTLKITERLLIADVFPTYPLISNLTTSE